MLDEWVANCTGAGYPISREELDRRVLEKLKKTVETAAKSSPFYSERLGGGKIRSFSDISGLPFTFPEDIRKEGWRMLTAPAGEIKRIVSLSTSGSSGEPKRICFSQADLLDTVEFFAHGLSEFVKKGDRVFLLFPGNNQDGLNDLIRRALAGLDCEGFYFGYPGPERLAELTEQIIELKITFLIGTAAAMADAARFSQKSGLVKAVERNLHGVLAAAAFVSEEDRQEIARIWNCPVDEFYGMTETGFTGAVGCSVPGGYHLWESGLYTEIVDPLTGEVLPDGKEGEIVITALNPRLMPLIRYRTGDRSRIIPGKCACGSCLKRLERVQERPVGKKFEVRGKIEF